jgi:hypothetical protein
VYGGNTLDVTGTFANQANKTFLVYGTANLGTLTNNGSTYIYNSGTLSAASVTNSSNLYVASGANVSSTAFTNASGATLQLAGFSSSTPGAVLDPLKYSSGGSTSVGSGATLVVGSGTVPGGTTGLYEFGNGTLAEMIFGSPNSSDTCTGSASDCGIIDVAGDVMLSGTLDPLLENGFDPTDGDSFIFLTFSGDRSGEFTSIADQYFDNYTQQWTITYGDGFEALVAAAYSAPPPVTGTPEPATLLLFGAGLMTLGLLARSKRKAKK